MMPEEWLAAQESLLAGQSAVESADEQLAREH